MNQEENAFRFINRLEAAIQDYRVGALGYAALVAYVNRLSTHF